VFWMFKVNWIMQLDSLADMIIAVLVPGIVDVSLLSMFLQWWMEHWTCKLGFGRDYEVGGHLIFLALPFFGFLIYLVGPMFWLI